MYVQENKIKYGTDSSNLTSKYDRNFIRNEVFQRLRNKFPKFEQGLTNSINFLREDYLLLNQLVDEIIQPIFRRKRPYTIYFNNNIPRLAWYHFFKNLDSIIHKLIIGWKSILKLGSILKVLLTAYRKTEIIGHYQLKQIRKEMTKYFTLIKMKQLESLLSLLAIFAKLFP